MAGEALFLGWGAVVRGREQFAPEVFQEAVGHYGKLQGKGQIERLDAYLLDPHGGDLAGFFLLDGEQSALDSIRTSPEFRGLLVRAGSVLDNLGLVSAYSADALEAGECLDDYAMSQPTMPMAATKELRASRWSDARFVIAGRRVHRGRWAGLSFWVG